jgi:hypothetical protein
MMADRNHSSGNFREHARNLLRPIVSPSVRPWSLPVTLHRKIILRSTTEAPVVLQVAVWQNQLSDFNPLLQVLDDTVVPMTLTADATGEVGSLDPLTK